MKEDSDKKSAKKAEEIKKAVFDMTVDAKKDAAHAEQKVSVASKETGKKVEKAGNEMKASLQQMKKDNKQFPKKADKKNRK